MPACDCVGEPFEDRAIGVERGRGPYLVRSRTHCGRRCFDDKTGHVALSALNRASSFREDSASTRDPQAGDTGAGDSSAPPVDTGDSPGSVRDLQAMQLRMMLGFEMAERDFRSDITQEALLAVITAMADVPGRKSLVLLWRDSIRAVRCAANCRT